jgi:carboxypeptidase Taq
VDAAFDQLRALAAEIADLEKASYLLSWDQETHMPSRGADERLHQYAALQRLVRERWTSDRLAHLLEDVAPLEAELDPRSDEGSLIRVMRRDSDKARRVPLDVQLELTDANAHGFQQWLVAREQQDFEVLRPQFERVLELRRAYAAAFEPQEDPYDALLDDYEPGMMSRAVDPIFAQVKAALLELLDALKDAPPTDDSCLSGRFPGGAQRRFTLWLIGQWGFETNSWRLDNSVHPSQFSLGSADVRITTWFDPTNLAGVFACFHEFGHGLYRRQVAPSLSRTPLREPASSALDESQSRLWENLVGRHLATWKFAYRSCESSCLRNSGTSRSPASTAPSTWCSRR